MICNNAVAAQSSDNRFAVSKEDCTGNAPLAFAAEAIFTATANFANNETVTIDSKVYTFQTSLSNTDGNVQIGSTLQNSLINLISAINLNGIAGTQYALSTVIHPTVEAIGVNETTFRAVAKVPGTGGNAINVADTSANGSFLTPTLEGGRLNQWMALDVNTVDGFGNVTESVARETFSDNRAVLPGGIVSVSSEPSFEHELTYSALEFFLPGMMYSKLQGMAPIKPSTTTGTQVTFPAITTPELNLVQYGAATAKSLFYLRGFSVQSNNGLKVASAAATATDFSLAGLTAETTSPTQLVELAGLRAPAGDLSISRALNILTLTSGGATNFITAGFKRGMTIFIGGDLAINRFNTGACYARVRDVNATSLVLDTINAKYPSTLGGLQNMTTPDLGSGKEIDIFYGRLCVSVPKSSPLYTKESYTIERVQGYSGKAPQYVYPVGNFINEFSLQLESQSKSTINLSMSGQQTEDVSAVRKPGAANVAPQDKRSLYNTATDIARIILIDQDGSARTSRLTDATLTVNNNITGEPALGELGDVFKPEGVFDVTIQFTSHLTDLTILNSILANTPFQFNFIKRNGDGTIAFDLPSGKLGDTSDTLEQNRTAKLEATFRSELDSFFNTSLQVTLLPYTPKA